MSVKKTPTISKKKCANCSDKKNEKKTEISFIIFKNIGDALLVIAKFFEKFIF